MAETHQCQHVSKTTPSVPLNHVAFLALSQQKSPHFNHNSKYYIKSEIFEILLDTKEKRNNSGFASVIKETELSKNYANFSTVDMRGSLRFDMVAPLHGASVNATKQYKWL